MALNCLLPNPWRTRKRPVSTRVSDDRPFTQEKYQESMYDKVKLPQMNSFNKERQKQEKPVLKTSSLEGNKTIRSFMRYTF